jgi:hypothetical protein
MKVVWVERVVNVESEVVKVATFARKIMVAAPQTAPNAQTKMPQLVATSLAGR